MYTTIVIIIITIGAYFIIKFTKFRISLYNIYMHFLIYYCFFKVLGI